MLMKSNICLPPDNRAGLLDRGTGGTQGPGQRRRAMPGAAEAPAPAQLPARETLRTIWG